MITADTDLSTRPIAEILLGAVYGEPAIRQACHVEIENRPARMTELHTDALAEYADKYRGVAAAKSTDDLGDAIEYSTNAGIRQAALDELHNRAITQFYGGVAASTGELVAQGYRRTLVQLTAVQSGDYWDMNEVRRTVIVADGVFAGRVQVELFDGTGTFWTDPQRPGTEFYVWRKVPEEG